MAKKYEIAMAEATSYEEWRMAALALDHIDGAANWREQAESPDYDYKLLASRVKVLRKLRRQKDLDRLIFRLREELHQITGKEIYIEIREVKDADAIIGMRFKLTPKILEAATKCKIIGCMSVGFDFIASDQRLTDPLIKENGELRKATWEEAIDLVAAKFKEIRDTHGGDSMGVLTSARVTNEENYIAHKFTRAVLKTNNIDHCARL